MNTISPYTLYRMAVVTSSGFETESEMGDALVELVHETGHELLEQTNLSQSQTEGIRLTLEQTPIAYSTLRDLINGTDWPEECKADLHFTLVQMMDNLLSLGALKGVDNEQALFSLRQRHKASQPRRKSGARGHLKELARSLYKDGDTAKAVWSRMTSAIRSDCTDMRFEAPEDKIIVMPCEGENWKLASYKESSFTTIFSEIRSKLKR